MGKVLDGFDFDAAHGNRIYPWEVWTDGNAREIEAGVDFTVDPEVMRNQLIVRAKAEGKTVKTSIRPVTQRGGKITQGAVIRFQFSIA